MLPRSVNKRARGNGLSLLPNKQPLRLGPKVSSSQTREEDMRGTRKPCNLRATRAFLQPANSTTDMTVSCDRHRARATAFKCKSPKGPVRFACPCVIVTAVNLSRLFLKRHDHLRFMHHKGKKKKYTRKRKTSSVF